MKVNVGGVDRVIRIIAGIVLLGAGWYYHSWWGLLGLAPLTAGIVRWCPGYLPFGWSTAKKSAPKA